MSADRPTSGDEPGQHAVDLLRADLLPFPPGLPDLPPGLFRPLRLHDRVHIDIGNFCISHWSALSSDRGTIVADMDDVHTDCADELVPPPLLDRDRVHIDTSNFSISHCSASSSVHTDCADELVPSLPQSSKGETSDDGLEEMYEQLSGRSAPHPVDLLRADLQWGKQKLRRAIDLWIMLGELDECEAGVLLAPPPI